MNHCFKQKLTKITINEIKEKLNKLKQKIEEKKQKPTEIENKTFFSNQNHKRNSKQRKYIGCLQVLTTTYNIQALSILK